MTAPERIWRDKPQIKRGYVDGLPSWPTQSESHEGTEYIRADIAAAMVAAEREALQARIDTLEAEIKQLRAASWAEGVRGGSMSDDLTPPHWGASEDRIGTTDSTISALIERVETHNDVPVSEIVATIAAMQARLAAAEKMAEAAEKLVTWDHCWPGNINLEYEISKLRAARAAWEAGK